MQIKKTVTKIKNKAIDKTSSFIANNFMGGNNVSNFETEYAQKMNKKYPKRF